MKKTRKILAFALALTMMISMFSIFGVVSAADESEESLGRIIDGYEPIPLLIIKVNFDADGDGKNNQDVDGIKLAHRDKNTKQYGEQWCYSEDSHWYDICFGDNHYSLNNYYKYISNDRFYWIPVEETSGTANDGVVTVTLTGVAHPNKAEGNNADKDGLGSGNERRLAIEAADQFIDFSKYDKNGNGQIEFTEMTVMYIYGGYEIAYSGKQSYKYAFPTHAHVSNFISLGIECDGVGVYASKQPYVRMGERGSTDWSDYGTIAHELGHVLGAKDLYTNASVWIGGCGNLSLMGSGSKGKANGHDSPTVLDPYYSVLYGFSNETVAKSGTNEYVLYSHESELGEYNVIRINTKNPNEYYLIENRSHSELGYDNNGLNDDDGKNNGMQGESMQGILIWHIDEDIIASTARPNNGGEGHAAGFTVITPTNNNQDVDNNSTWSSTSVRNVFVASNEAEYKFPVSDPEKNPGTWYTAMTPEEAAQCNIKVEFLTEPGNEMTVRISGAIDLPATVVASVSGTTQTTMNIKAAVTDYNGSQITSCKVLLSTKSDMSNPMEKVIDLSKGLEFEAAFDGLTADTEYFYTVEMETTHGVSRTKVSSAYTNSIVVEKAKVTLVINSDRYKKPVTQNVNVGNTLDVSRISLEKKGYTFGGWYLDEACTQEYDFAPIASAGEFTLYAKWVADAAIGTTATTTPDNTTAPGTTPTEPGAGGDNGSIVTIVVIAVVAVAVIGGGVTAVVIVNKKKTK